jgi:hypothetical protein
MADANYHDPANHEAASQIVGQEILRLKMFGSRTEVLPVEAGQL